VWVANSGDDTVTRIGITSGGQRTIDVGDGPSAVAYGSGSVWIANHDGRSVMRIDPTTGDVTATIPVGNAPAGLAVAGDLVWVSMQAP
jgi:YVTN family beta-propeller protein